MKFYLLSITWCFIFFSCGDGQTTGKSIQEIKVTKDKLSISDIVRNPVSANEPTDTTNVAKFDFEETEYNFGAVLEGAQVKHVFKFTNVGKVPLVINDARSTCGCTVPEWPEDPILPGEKGEISVVFNTVRKLENQTKPVTITANTYPARTVLKIKGYVKPQRTNPLIKKPKKGE